MLNSTSPSTRPTSGSWRPTLRSSPHARVAGDLVPVFSRPQPLQKVRTERVRLLPRELRLKHRRNLGPYLVKTELAGLAPIIHPEHHRPVAVDLHRLAVVAREHVVVEGGRHHRGIAEHFMARLPAPREVLRSRSG